MAVTLKDVAEKAGVSISTVSRILNDDRSRPASEKTQRKVWDVVKELGYTPNKSAVDLIKGQATPKKEKLVGLLHLACPFSMNDPFYLEIMTGAQKELMDSGLGIAFTMTVTMANYQSLYKIIAKKELDGLVIFGRINNEMIDFFNQFQGILVYVGDQAIEGEWHQVLMDGKKAIEDLLNQFIHLNEIGYIGEVDHEYNRWYGRKYRYSVFERIMNKRNIQIEPTDIIESRSQIESAYRAVNRAIEENRAIKSCYFCSSDYIAMGAMRAFKSHGYRIPEDVQLLAMDNIEMSRYVTPSLTTIDVPTEAMGRYAVTLLKEQLNRPKGPAVKVELPFEIVVRESTK